MSSMNGRQRPPVPAGQYRSPGAPEPGRGGIPDGAIVGLLATLLGATALVWFSTALGALLTRGRLPHPLPFAGTPGAIRSLAMAPNSIGAAWPGTPVAQLPSATTFWVTFFVLLALLIALALTILTAWMRLRSTRGRGHDAPDDHAVPLEKPLPGPAGQGTFPLPRVDPAAAFQVPLPAPAAPIPFTPATPAPPVTPTAAMASPPPARPQPFAFPSGMTALLVPDPDAVATAVRRRLLQRAVETATGPVLVVTDDLALWQARPPHRDARLFDPLRLVDDVPDAETRVRWAPHDHCDNPATAATRARALLAPTMRGGASEARSQTERGIRETAQTLLRCWLHAAALDGRPFRHVQRWASGTARGEALTILRSADPHQAGDGWDGELQALLMHSTDLRDSAIERILDALDVLSELQVQQACAPSSAADGLDVESLLRNRGTLYLLGRPTETRVSRSDGTHGRRSAMPLLTALAEDVVERARQSAIRSSGGRLDPPLLCVLDNVAAVAPFPGLPELLARGGPLGLGGVAVFRSPEQALARWDERAVHSLWTNADARAVVGPLGGAGLQALLGVLHTPAPELEGALAGPGAPSGLAGGELLLLAARRPAQRFAAAPAAVASGSHTAPQ